MTLPAWTWIALTLMAALAQTFRNAAQRRVSGTQGTLPATLVRFVFGLPFACLWLAAVMAWLGVTPRMTWAFAGWVAIGAIGQLVATALLLKAMQERNFVIGVVFAKTEIVQVAILSWLLLADTLPPVSILAIAIATAGVILLSMDPATLRQAGFLRSLRSPAAAYGLASGAAFAISILGYRAAALAVPEMPAILSGAFGVACAQALQSVLLGGWLYLRQPAALAALAGEWRISVAAGMLGTIASAGWFTAVALNTAAEVRALGLVEVFFTYAVSRKLMGENTSTREIAGIVLVMIGVLLICLRAL
ncbi:MAG: DMT family transporter [Burkholderiales bacterium]|nr:DMT family transporter [Burkholderiales bacterium]